MHCHSHIYLVANSSINKQAFLMASIAEATFCMALCIITVGHQLLVQQQDFVLRQGVCLLALGRAHAKHTVNVEQVTVHGRHVKSLVYVGHCAVKDSTPHCCQDVLPTWQEHRRSAQGLESPLS